MRIKTDQLFQSHFMKGDRDVMKEKSSFVKTAGKKAAVFALTGMCACAFMMPAAFGGGVHADAAKKAKKPAQVTGLRAAKVTDDSITLSWNKAKNAKTYKVFKKKNVWSKWKKTKKNNYAKYKGNKDKYKVKKKGKKYLYKVKRPAFAAITPSTKKTKAAIDTGIKEQTKYTFKVRAYNGKKAGKLSKAITIKTKARSTDNKNGTYDKPGQTMTMDIDGRKVQLTVGKVCTVPSFSFINSSTYVDQVKVSQVYADVGDEEYEFKYIAGTTTDGKKFSISTDKQTGTNHYSCGLDSLENKYFYIDRRDTPKEYGAGIYTKIKDKDVKIVWTVDNTEPSLDQTNSTKPGWCLYTVSDHTWINPDKNIFVPEMNKTLLKGTYTCDEAKDGKKDGKYIYENSDSLYYPRTFWMKVYKGDKLIHEEYWGCAMKHMDEAKEIYDKYVKEHSDEAPGELE